VKFFDVRATSVSRNRACDRNSFLLLVCLVVACACSLLFVGLKLTALLVSPREHVFVWSQFVAVFFLVEGVGRGLPFAHLLMNRSQVVSPVRALGKGPRSRFLGVRFFDIDVERRGAVGPFRMSGNARVSKVGFGRAPTEPPTLSRPDLQVLV